LAEVIAAEGPLSIAQVTGIGLRLLDVLQAAHRVGILHCDVKPANVHLCDDGRVVLTDFGIACSLVDEPGEPTQMLAASAVYIQRRSASVAAGLSRLLICFHSVRVVRCG
jgi:serine/threonine protein kinase